MFGVNRALKILPIFQNQSYHCKLAFLSTVTATQNDQTLPHFKIAENNPINHTRNHLYRYYVIPQEIKSKLYLTGGIPSSLDVQMKTFKEAAIMVREPALELFSYLKKINFLNPAVRFIIYGRNGTGKTSTLIHLIHYAFVSNFLLVHVPWVSNWTKHVKEVEPSQYKEKRIDLPVESALWLQHFKIQNASLLDELKLKTSKSYVWSKRETTEAGAPLTEVIEHGLTRVRHSSDCVAVLLKEIKHHSQFGNFKTMVVVDGVNAFYAKTNVRITPKIKALADDVTIVHAFKKLLNNDWNNAAVVTTVDVMPHNRNASMQDAFTPRHLLGKEGFELLDPFIPIQTNKYTDIELENVIDYYCDRLWIQDERARSEEGRQQLKFLSGSNPYVLRKLCDPL